MLAGWFGLALPWPGLIRTDAASGTPKYSRQDSLVEIGYINKYHTLYTHDHLQQCGLGRPLLLWSSCSVNNYTWNTVKNDKDVRSRPGPKKGQAHLAAVIKVGIEPYSTTSCGTEMNQRWFMRIIYWHEAIKFKKSAGVWSVLWASDHNFSVARFLTSVRYKNNRKDLHLHGIVSNFINPHPNTRRQACSHDSKLLDQVQSILRVPRGRRSLLQLGYEIVVSII